MNHRILFFFIICGNLWSQNNDELSYIYLKQAQEVISSGGLDQAQELLVTSLEFQDKNSDALTLLGNLELQKKLIPQAKDHLEKALGYNRFKVVRPGEALRSLLGIHLRLKNYSTIENMVQKSSVVLDLPQMILLFGALDRSGQTQKAQDVLSQADEYHPLDPVLLESLLRYPRNTPSLENRLGKHKKDTGGFTIADLDRLSRRLPSSPEDGKWVLAKLNQLGYDSPELNLQLFLHELRDFTTYWEKLKLLGPGKDYESLIKMIVKPRALDQQDQLMGFFSAFTGNLDWDRDRDGWAESTLEFNQGTLVQWTGDQDQDEKSDLVLKFTQGVLENIRESGSHGSFSVTFEEFPYLKTLEIQNNPGRRVYTFAPFKTSWAVVQETVKDIPPFLVPAYWIWSEDQLKLEKLLTQVVLLEQFSGSNQLIKRSRLISGEEFLREEDTNGDGRRDQMVVFKEGGVSQAWRDMDGDGHPEILEKILDKGKILWADSQGDQITDYMLSPGGWKVWDFNQDGEPDFRYLDLPQGETLKIVSYRGRSDALELLPPWESFPWP